jgi:predicted ATPase
MAAFDDVPAHEWEQLVQVLDARIDDLSGEQRALAVERAVRRIGAGEFDARDDGHVRILWDELRAATLGALLDRLVAAGELEVAGVADSGHLVHRRPRTG